MPLIRGKRFKRLSPPEDLKPDEELFLCNITKEAFRDYNKYCDRIIQCMSVLWSCSLTGKIRLTFEEAVRSEEKARLMLREFPNAMKKPVLFLASLTSTGRRKDMCNDVFGFVKKRFFVQEEVEVYFDDIKKKCQITKVVCQDSDASIECKNDFKIKLKGVSPDKMEYVVVEKETGRSITVTNASISRVNGSLTNENVRLLLKQHTYCQKGIWKVKNTTIVKFQLQDFDFGSVHAGPLPKYASLSSKIDLVLKSGGLSTSVGVNSVAKKKTKEELRKSAEQKKDMLKKRRKEKLEKEREERRKEVKRRLEENRERLRLQRIQEREKRKGEQLKIEECLRSWIEPREDLECDDLKPLPIAIPVESNVSGESFGNALMVLEFLDKFSTFTNLKDTFPQGFHLEHLEKALTETDIHGYFSDLLQLLLTSLFQLKDWDVAKPKPILKRDQTLSHKVPDLTPDLNTEESNKISDAALMWPQIYHGTTLDKWPLDSFTVTEILRLHILSSGSTRDNSYEVGVNGVSYDPGFKFKFEELELVQKLSSASVFQLNGEEKLKILFLLTDQISSCAAVRNHMADSFAKARPLYYELKQVKWAIGRLRKEERKNKKVAEGVPQQCNDIAEKKKEYLTKEHTMKTQMKLLQSSYQRQSIGLDRWHRRYWVMNSVPGIFVEDPRFQQSLLQPTQECADVLSDDSITDNGYIALMVLKKAADKERRMKEILTDVTIIQDSIKLNKRKLSDLDLKGEAKDFVDYLQGKNPTPTSSYSGAMECGACTPSIPSGEIHPPGKKWFYYKTSDDLNALLDSLNPRGLRESRLRKALLNNKESLMDMLSNFSYKMTSKPLPASSQLKVKKPYRNATISKISFKPDFKRQTAMEVVLRNIIIELELRILEAGLGKLKVPCPDAWRKKIQEKTFKLVSAVDSAEAKFVANSDKSVKELASCLQQIAEGIETRFLVAPLNAALSSKDQEGDTGKSVFHGYNSRLDLWKESLMESTSFSQLFVHLGTLERSVAWCKSILRAYCRICRGKSDDEHMLLCDGCNRGHHLYCLKPRMKAIPKGDWFCSSCKPPEKVISTRKKVGQLVEREESEEETDDEMQSEDESEFSSEVDPVEVEDMVVEVEEVCESCGDYGTVMCCDRCPKLYHPECIGLKRIPRGEWLCPTCKKMD